MCLGVCVCRALRVHAQQSGPFVQVSCLSDLESVEECRGVLSGIREWFRWYKTPDGKPPNAFALDERALNEVDVGLSCVACVDCEGVRVSAEGGLTLRLRALAAGGGCGVGVEAAPAVARAARAEGAGGQAVAADSARAMNGNADPLSISSACV